MEGLVEHQSIGNGPPVTVVNLKDTKVIGEKHPTTGPLPLVLMPLTFQVEDLKTQLVSKDDSQRLVEQEVQEKLREAQECSQNQKELEREKAR